jgi:hypothetical protein
MLSKLQKAFWTSVVHCEIVDVMTLMSADKAIAIPIPVDTVRGFFQAGQSTNTKWKTWLPTQDSGARCTADYAATKIWQRIMRQQRFESTSSERRSDSERGPEGSGCLEILYRKLGKNNAGRLAVVSGRRTEGACAAHFYGCSLDPHRVGTLTRIPILLTGTRQNSARKRFIVSILVIVSILIVSILVTASTLIVSILVTVLTLSNVFLLAVTVTIVVMWWCPADSSLAELPASHGLLEPGESHPIGPNGRLMCGHITFSLIAKFSTIFPATAEQQLSSV